MTAQDFLAECGRRGWTVKPLSSRALKLSKAGSVLLASAQQASHAETLERVRAADDFARQHRRP
jgi:hypothetical protein